MSRNARRVNSVYLSKHQYISYIVDARFMMIQIFDIQQNIPQFQRQWLRRVEIHILQHDPAVALNIAEIARAAGVSERQFYRQIKLLLGITPNSFIQRLRLERAKSMLESGAYPTVSEVAYAAGFNCPDYFSNLFYKKYGTRPARLLWRNARFTPGSQGGLESATGL